MFERFTDRARRVVVLSQEEALRLDHTYVAAEHLFLGVLAVEDAEPARVLRAQGVTLERARAELERMQGRGSGPSGHIPFTAGAKRALEASLVESVELGQSQITVRHLMLGLLRVEPDEPGLHAFLEGLGVDAARLRANLSMGAGTERPSDPVTSSEPDVRIVTEGLQFPEGPIAMADGSLLVVEVRRGTLSRVGADGSVEVVAEVGGGPNGAAIGPDGAAYVVNNGGFVWNQVGNLTLPMELDTGATQAADYTGGWVERVDLGTGEVTRLYEDCDGERLLGPNDIVFDAEGGFWFTDFGKVRARDQDRGALYYARPDGSRIEQMAFPILGPNGVGLSPGGDRVYVAETYTGRLLAWDVAGPGQLAGATGMGHGATVVAATPDHFDSIAVEAGGNVAVAAITQGVAVITPDGDISHVAMPDPIVTNVCFAGTTAFVTLSGRGALARLEWPRPGLELAFSA